MGKKGSGSSWLTAVKRAFRSPSKELSDKSTTRNCRRKQDDSHHEHEDEADNKKKEKRRWLFRKGTTQESQPEPIVGSSSAATNTTAQDDQRHAIAVAVATAAAEAAVATAQAAMEAARITTTTTTITARQRATAREHYAATVIQTAFRSYLARRALRALKGLVKLQALVRGHNVRRQAKMTLKCMQALVRVQESVLDQRVRLRSHDGSQKSTFSDTASLLDSRYTQDIFSERKSVSHSRETSSIANGWDERPHTVEEVKAMLQSRRGAVAAAYERDRSSFRGDDELDQDKPRWLDRWMATRHWEGRASVDHCRSEPTFKTVEMDTSSQQQLPYTYLQRPPRRTHSLIQQQHYQQRPASPIHHRAHSHSSHLHQQSPATPSPSRTRPIQVRSASPRCLREDVGYHGSSQTPSLQSNYHYNGFLNRHNRGGPGGGIAMSSVAASYAGMGGASIPNYMAATESAKARIRSQSAPRQRPSTPERDRGVGSVKKRLSFPVPPAPEGYAGGVYGGGYSLRSPSFKSMSRVPSGYTEQESIYTSCYTDSLAGGEISPSSTSEMRRWLT